MAQSTTAALELVGLDRLMDLTRGRRDLLVGLIDGPVESGHPGLADARIVAAGAASSEAGTAMAAARAHGTFVAGILAGRRDSGAPGICPDCTILSRPIFTDDARGRQTGLPSATAEELAAAIVDCVGAGARVVNLSVALSEPSPNAVKALERAIEHAAQRGCMLIAAAGNQATVGTTSVTRHPWVVPVTACDLNGRPLAQSNFSASAGRGGVAAPGEGISSLGAGGGTTTAGGTSAATPFVTGAVALLATLLPSVPAAMIRYAIPRPGENRRTGIVPPLLNAWATFQHLKLHWKEGEGHGLGRGRAAAGT